MGDLRYVIARSGLVHEFDCDALSHDGPCECPLVLGVHEPRRRPTIVSVASTGKQTRDA